MSGDVRLLWGSGNPGLARAIASEINIPAIACTAERFPDGEIAVRLGEPLRLREVLIVQPTSPPVNDHLVELLALADLCRRAAAVRIVAVVPYFGYARSDKRHGRREPIMGRMVADMLQWAGIDHVLTVDLHTPQLEGFFRIPVDSLSAVPVLAGALAELVATNGSEMVVVSPDAGRVKMATQYAERLGLPLTVLLKRRESGTETTVTHIVGDVKDRRCLVIDDMISTGGTIASSARALVEAGAHPDVVVAATHGLFSGDAKATLREAGVRKVFVTDTVPQDEADPFVGVVTIAPMLAEAIFQVTRNVNFQPTDL